MNVQPSSNVKLWLLFHDSAKLALSIPLAQCTNFAVHPLKWLRFLGYAIFGQSGYLSTLKAGPEIDDYTTNIEPRSYYFISNGKFDRSLTGIRKYLANMVHNF